ELPEARRLAPDQEHLHAVDTGHVLARLTDLERAVRLRLRILEIAGKEAAQLEVADRDIPAEPEAVDLRRAQEFLEPALVLRLVPPAQRGDRRILRDRPKLGEVGRRRCDAV